MSRTLLAVVGLSAVFAVVGCAAGPIEMAVTPMDDAAASASESDAPVAGTNVPVEDLAFEEAADAIPAFSAELVVDVERGYLFGGEYVPEFAGPAYRWTLAADLDPAAGYGYLAIGGLAEPGDGVCSELLQTPDDVWSRSFALGERPGDFAPAAEGSDVLADYATAFPRTAEELADAHGVPPWSVTEADDGTTETVTILDAAGVAAVRSSLFEPGGITTEFDSGTLTSVSDADGAIRSLVLAALVETESTREVLDIDLRFGAPGTPVTVADPWTPTVGCPSIATDLAGAWAVVAVAASPTADLEGLADATILFGADGAFSGTTGCKAFSGSATFGYSWFDDASLETSGEPCAGLVGVVEADLIAALAGGDLSIDGDGRLLLVDGDTVAVVFERL